MIYVWNGNLVENAELNLSPVDQGLVYGYGVFETIKTVNQQLAFFAEHMERLAAGCKAINITLDIKTQILEQNCYDLINKLQLMDGALRITCLKNNSDYNVLITARKNSYQPSDYQKGFRLCFADTKRNQHSLLVRVKSNNYLENILVRQKALEQGYNEAIFMNTEDKLAEGSLSNLFFVKDGVIYTPSIECGLLPGIVRDKVIAICGKSKLPLCLGEYRKSDILAADEVFLTNSLMEIMPVSLLERSAYNLSNNEITRSIIEQYRHKL